MATEHKRQQQLHGPWSDFDPGKMLTGELAVVTSGDPHSDTGRAIYICFGPGIVKRFTTYEDFENELASALSDLKKSFAADMTNATAAANSAAAAAQAAQKAADAAAKRANDAAAACEGLTDNKRVEELETKMNQVIEALSNALSTE